MRKVFAAVYARPALARYMATSACFINSEIFFACSGKTAVPILALIVTSVPSTT